VRIGRRDSSTRKERLGIACFIKAFISWSTSPRTIEFGFPQDNLQIKLVRELPNANQFISYIDAVGELDGVRCVMDWKTTSSRYPEEPIGLLSLDAQLICYSWITGISEVALVVFMQKHHPEIQYLKTSVSEEQRLEFGRLLANTIRQIESAQFPLHSGIRFRRMAVRAVPTLVFALRTRD
jgi:hypothetical protein